MHTRYRFATLFALLILGVSWPASQAEAFSLGVFGTFVVGGEAAGQCESCLVRDGIFAGTSDTDDRSSPGFGVDLTLVLGESADLVLRASHTPSIEYDAKLGADTTLIGILQAKVPLSENAELLLGLGGGVYVLHAGDALEDASAKQVERCNDPEGCQRIEGSFLGGALTGTGGVRTRITEPETQPLYMVAHLSYSILWVDYDRANKSQANARFKATRVLLSAGLEFDL